ncbi:SIS domain-containing protein [Arthrobacter sp. Soil762]|uniref:SIS domain-containing protein n=1 Tax=Arthrobacter sp. Soil762 TaxID=1736401 RepID=UPI0006FFF697|nr:SIS domain-containing protein [Arthrobacter sp. Soil762]KRE72735.1 hypothetical protein ASG77_08710 [Arthrobacter sp. Soil762]
MNVTQMNVNERLKNLIDGLDAAQDVVPLATQPLGKAVFVGSGDSLSSALLATSTGHRALSSGDLTWTGRLPFDTDMVVGISHSGSSAATVRSLQVARDKGTRTIAITSNASSPLAAAADEVQLVPALRLQERIPSAGHLMLGLGVAALLGIETKNATSDLARLITRQVPVIENSIGELPAQPVGISVLTLPELRCAGDFWMLKLIEAVGITVRTVALEESGHVDYFLGPEPRLALQLAGADGADRFKRLATALESTGQTVSRIDFVPPVERDLRSNILFELAAAAAGAMWADAAAEAWGRPPFRGGAVNMDASHIQL